MLSAERHEDIVRRVEAEGSVRTLELSALYGVTPDCVRKDLRTLEKQGLLRRTYGGAVRVRVNRHDLEVASRLGRNAEGKRRIASRAVQLIAPGSTVFLDISTTNIELARLLLAGAADVTVVTNMLEVAGVFSRPGGPGIIVAGGSFNSTRDGFVGSLTDEQIRRFRFDVAFLGAAGIDAVRGTVLTYLPEDGLTKSAALSVSRSAYLLAETSKLSEDGDYVYADLDQFTGLILDGPPPRAEMDRLAETGLAVLYENDTEQD